MKRTVTIFRSLHDVSAGFNRDVISVLNRIKEGNSRDAIEQIRKLPKDKGDELKRVLPGACFNGTFKHRSISGLIQHSGLMIVDIDGFDSIEQSAEERNIASQDRYTFASWISPSGRGIKILVKIPSETENHKSYFRSYKEYLNHPNWDDSGSDVSRFCFESYDPELYLNTDSELWVDKEEPDVEDIGVSNAIIPLTDDRGVMSRLLDWWNKKFGATKGSRNTNLYKLAIACNDFGIDVAECEFQLMKFESKDFPASEVRTIVKSAYSKVENFGTKFFEDRESQQKIEKLVRAGKKQKDIVKSFSGSVDADTVEEYIDSVKENMDIDEFWFYDDKNKIKLSIHKFKFWLEQNNIFKYYPSENSSTFSFIKRYQNLLEETTSSHIKDFTLNYILNKPDIGFGPYDFMAGNGSYFHPNFLSMIDTTNVVLKEDTKDTCYIYYRNCVLEITKDNVREVDYVDLDGFVWRKQVIDRDFVKHDHHDSVYRKFMWLISGKDVGRYNSLKSVVGYLMHSFKTSANNRAIIFNDETISENPNGGSGKGLFWNALKYMKNVSSIDGKTFKFEKSFPYQTVSTDTQVLVFDDVQKNFNFENLFSLITEGITLEYKGQDAIQIPVEQSPKLLITTNYTIGGVGGSHDRRKFEIEMSAYFNSNHTPLDEFGHMLFADWDDEEWLRFDNYMINCAQYYLENGLVMHEYHNLDDRKFIKETSYEFYEFVKEGNLRVNERMNKSVYYQRFIDEYKDFQKLSQRRFTKWMEAWGKFKGYEHSDGKSGNERWIHFSDGTDSVLSEDFPF